jgi:hypothetical protein
MNVRFWTPQEYYNAFEWNDSFDIMTLDSDFFITTRNLFSNMGITVKKQQTLKFLLPRCFEQF